MIPKEQPVITNKNMEWIENDLNAKKREFKFLVFYNAGYGNPEFDEVRDQFFVYNSTGEILGFKVYARPPKDVPFVIRDDRIIYYHPIFINLQTGEMFRYANITRVTAEAISSVVFHHAAIIVADGLGKYTMEDYLDSISVAFDIRLLEKSDFSEPPVPMERLAQSVNEYLESLFSPWDVATYSTSISPEMCRKYCMPRCTQEPTNCCLKLVDPDPPSEIDRPRFHHIHRCLVMFSPDDCPAGQFVRAEYHNRFVSKFPEDGSNPAAPFPGLDVYQRNVIPFNNRDLVKGAIVYHHLFLLHVNNPEYRGWKLAKAIADIILTRIIQSDNVFDNDTDIDIVVDANDAREFGCGTNKVIKALRLAGKNRNDKMPLLFPIHEISGTRFDPGYCQNYFCFHCSECTADTCPRNPSPSYVVDGEKFTRNQIIELKGPNQMLEINISALRPDVVTVGFESKDKFIISFSKSEGKQNG
jgi:hypothetical protein